MSYRTRARARDPYWTKALHDQVLPDGTTVKKGDRIWYTPATRTVLVGEKAEQAARDFEAACFDEAQMSGGM